MLPNGFEGQVARPKEPEHLGALLPVDGVPLGSVRDEECAVAGAPFGDQVAAVDFQYVGGGCGMKDVAYFIGSCLAEEECERLESWLQDGYFAALKQALEDLHSAVDAEAMEEEWRALFPLAWTDFHRFLKGWSPGHWKLNAYSERLARGVIESFGG